MLSAHSVWRSCWCGFWGIEGASMHYCSCSLRRRLWQIIIRSLYVVAWSNLRSSPSPPICRILNTNNHSLAIVRFLLKSTDSHLYVANFIAYCSICYLDIIFTMQCYRSTVSALSYVSVCLSVCLSYISIVSKWLNTGSYKKATW